LLTRKVLKEEPGYTPWIGYASTESVLGQDFILPVKVQLYFNKHIPGFVKRSIES